MEHINFEELNNGEEITVEKLALMIGKGFAHVDQRFDEAATKKEMDEGFAGVNARLDHLDARVGRIEADIHELQGEVVYRHEFEDILGRVKYLEKKLGIESGV